MGPALFLALSVPEANAAWGTTIDVAGRQRMLTQRMSKEFLLVSLGLDPEGNKARMMGSINLFNVSLNALINGNPDLNIFGAPSDLVRTSFQGVVDLWVPFAQLLISNVDTVRDAFGNVDAAVLDAVAAGNVPLLVQSNVCVGRLVDAAKSAGAQTNGLVVDTAGRQRMLIQRMCKESFLIASGVSVSTNVALLKSNENLFATSHEGIIGGARWAGVSTLSKMCTLHQMREVSYTFGLFRPLIQEILNAQSVAESLQIALSLAPEIAERSGPLFGAMVAAVSLYVNDPGECDPLASMTEGSWSILLLNMGNVITLGQFAVAYFMQIANRVSVQSSTVGLIVEVATVSTTMNNLIQGNKAENIEAPPTQELVDLFLSANSLWGELVVELNTAVGAESISLVVMTKVEQTSEALISTLTNVKDRMVELVLTSLPNHNGYALQVANEQPLMLAKLVTVVNMVFGGVDPDSNRLKFNTTRDAFLQGHIDILQGKPSAGGLPAIPRLDQICAVQFMQQIYANFQVVLADGQAAMAGSTVALSALSVSSDQTAQLTKRFVDFYAENASFQCENQTMTYADWLDVIQAVGDLRAYSQESTTVYLTASSSGGPTEAALVTTAKNMVEEQMRSLAYGSETLRPPTSQRILDEVLARVEPPVSAFAESLEGSNGNAVAAASLTMIEALNQLQNLYIDEATAAFPSLPAARVDAASRQILLAQKGARESIQFIYGITGSNAAVFDTMSQWQAVQDNLKNGGNGLPAISPQRPDLSQQWQEVQIYWDRLKEWLTNAGPNDVSSLQDSLAEYVQQQEIILDMYKLEDLEEAESFPWMFVAYGVMGLFLLCCACGAVYVHWSTRRKASGHNQGQVAGSQA